MEIFLSSFSLTLFPPLYSTVPSEFSGRTAYIPWHNIRYPFLVILLLLLLLPSLSYLYSSHIIRFLQHAAAAGESRIALDWRTRICGTANNNGIATCSFSLAPNLPTDLSLFNIQSHKMTVVGEFSPYILLIPGLSCCYLFWWLFFMH